MNMLTPQIPKPMTSVLPDSLMNRQMKLQAVKLLLETQNDPERLKALVNLSGLSIPLLRQWKDHIEQYEPEIYAQLVMQANEDLAKVLQVTESTLLELSMYVYQVEQVNRLLKSAVNGLRPVFNCWEHLPLVWRVAASIHAGSYTIDEALKESRLNRDVLARCIALLKVVQPSGGLNG